MAGSCNLQEGYDVVFITVSGAFNLVAPTSTVASNASGNTRSVTIECFPFESSCTVNAPSGASTYGPGATSSSSSLTLAAGRSVTLATNVSHAENSRGASRASLSVRLLGEAQGAPQRYDFAADAEQVHNSEAKEAAASGRVV